MVTDTSLSPPAQQLLLGSLFGRESDPNISLKTIAPPTLDVLGAFYGYSDVSNALNNFTNAQQTIVLDLSKLQNYFQTYIKPGDNAPVKVLSILYRFHGQDMKLWASTATTGTLTISPDVQPTTSPNLCRRPRAGESNLLGLVWGDGKAVSPSNPQWPLAEVYNDKIFASMEFTPTTAFFDGLSPGSVNTCHVYYQYGITGDVQSVAGTTTKEIVLVPRNMQGFDPPAARGLLHPDESSPSFILRTSTTLPFGVESVASNSTWQLVCSPSQTSVYFIVVPANTLEEFNMPFSMLKIYIASLKKWAYLGMPQNSSWSALDGQPASFMIPGQGCSSNPADWALAFNYEIPSRNDEAGLMFGLSQYRGPNQAPYNSSFLIMHQHGSVARVMLMSLQMALHYLPGTTFEPQFMDRPDATPLTNGAMIALNAEDSVMDSCFVQTLA